MIDIYYSEVGEQLNNYRFNELLGQLPLQMHNQILKYRKWQDRQRGLLGKLLLKKGLEKLNLNGYSLNNLQYNTYNRPYFNDKIDFNISHSGNYVICAVARDVRVGVDIEEIQEIPISDFDLQFSHKELAEISASSCPFREFYNYWTKKESFLKAIGVGLNIPLNLLDISNNEVLWEGEKWFLTDVFIDKNYATCVCTNSIFTKWETNRLYFY